MMYEIVKRYGHSEGLSCVFRQFRAPETHCSKLHGYPLAFEFTFEADDLDSRNWVISFGELKPLKEWLKDTFDHKLLVSIHDPKIAAMLELEEVYDIAQVVFVEEVGCEMFAKMAFEQAKTILEGIQEQGRAYYARLKSVKVSEHDGNTAIYYGPDDNTWYNEESYTAEESDAAALGFSDNDSGFGYKCDPFMAPDSLLETNKQKNIEVTVPRPNIDAAAPLFKFNL